MWNISSVLTYPLSVSWVNCPVCSLAQLWAGCLFPYSSVFTRFVLWVCLCVLDYQSFIPWVFCDLSLLVFLVRSCFKTVKKILNYLWVSSHGKPSLEMRPSLHSPKKPEHIWLQVPAAYNSVHSTPPHRIMAAFASFYCSRQQWIRLTGGLWMTMTCSNLRKAVTVPCICSCLTCWPEISPEYFLALYPDAGDST